MYRNLAFDLAKKHVGRFFAKNRMVAGHATLTREVANYGYSYRKILRYPSLVE